ncbi:rRNA-processing protein bfr2 [Lambiella insularis]|nr:rRNA-processing protein bfr2 [Lambiella insularis]
MANSLAIKSLAEQIAELDEPTPRDFDPEDSGGPIDAGGDLESGDEDANHENAREHYVDVSKSKLRKPQQPSLGPRYAGSQVSRDALLSAEESDDDPFGIAAKEHEEMETDEDDQEEDVVDPDYVSLTGMEVREDDEIDSDEAFGEGDEEVFKSFTFQGSTEPQKGVQGSKKIRKKVLNTRDMSARMKSQEHIRPFDEGTKLEEVSNVEQSQSSSPEDEDMMSVDDSDTTGGGFDSEDSDDNGIESDSDISDPDNRSTPEVPRTDDRAALRKMMAEEQTTVLANISAAAKADAAKGRAVKRQRLTFDTLLNTRIRLQKALVATNSLSTSEITPQTVHLADPISSAATIHAAEAAALDLWNSLSALRHSLHPSSSPAPTASLSTPTSTLQHDLRTQDATALSLHRATLTKWAAKTHLPSSLPPRNRLSAAPTPQPLTSVLDAHLSGSSLSRLLARTRVPRSCAPLQAQAPPAAAAEHADIYDDADFYTLLLRELVEQKMAASTSDNPASHALAAADGLAGVDLPSLARLAKVRRTVDTKASKGRQMRYTVHEKLQNFMAREDRGTWGERQVGDLFGGLLGRRVVGGLGEGEGEGKEEGEDEELGGETEGLRLFNGAT